MKEILDTIEAIEQRMVDHQSESGFETVFDFIAEDLEAIRQMVVNKNAHLPNVSGLFVLFKTIEGDEYYWDGSEWSDSKENCRSFSYEKAIEYAEVFDCRFTDAE